MKKLGLLLLMATIMFTGVSTIMAQDTHEDSHLLKISIPNIALLDIESASGTDVELNPTHSGEAGDALDFSLMTNNDLWLNYSSIKPAADATRSIQVLLDIAVPAGMTLNLTAANPSSGAGDRGSSLPVFAPNNTTSTNVITGIGSCYTIDGDGNGVNLTYQLLMDASNYEDLVAGDQADITVTYTMVDDA